MCVCVKSYISDIPLNGHVVARAWAIGFGGTCPIPVICMCVITDIHVHVQDHIVGEDEVGEDKVVPSTPVRMSMNAIMRHIHRQPKPQDGASCKWKIHHLVWLWT